MILKKDNLTVSLTNNIQIAAFLSSGWKVAEPQETDKKKKARAAGSRPASEKV